MRAGSRATRSKISSVRNHFHILWLLFIQLPKSITFPRTMNLFLVLFGTVPFSLLKSSKTYHFIPIHTSQNSLWKHQINVAHYKSSRKEKTSSHNINYIQIDLKADLVFSFTNQKSTYLFTIHFSLWAGFYIFQQINYIMQGAKRR